MPEHKLKKGIDFIEGIKELGNLLGYHVQFEKPISEEKNNSPAVDIAWYKEENQKFPLFIFEIESTASNGMAYNPMKVFSKKNEQFEKPLFFFQIVLKGGQDSSRIEDLKNQFGNYNYRIYRTSEDEDKKLVLDVLEQHRRLSQDLNVIELCNYLIGSSWINIDIELISKHIIYLEFEKNSGNLLSSFITLSSSNSVFINLTIQLLKEIHTDFFFNQNKINYQSYLGNTWCFPIHLGILYSSTNDLYTKEKISNKLKYWQEKNSYMTMIGPHFGLSRDYDEFLVWGSGGLFGLLSFLFHESDIMRLYFAKELFKIIDKSSSEYKIINLLWVLHIIPISDPGKGLFGKAMTELKKLKGFSYEALLKPPFLNADEEWIEQFQSQNDSIPDYKAFQQFVKSKKEIDRVEKVKTACKFLVCDYVTDEMIETIIKI
jgi:hypothetical protein